MVDHVSFYLASLLATKKTVPVYSQTHYCRKYHKFVDKDHIDGCDLQAQNYTELKPTHYSTWWDNEETTRANKSDLIEINRFSSNLLFKLKHV